MNHRRKFMSENMSLGLATLTIHGSAQRDAHGSPHTPIYNTTTFAFPSTAESPVTQPCTTTHHGLAPEERFRRGTPDTMLRLSIGLKDAADLIADLEQALT
jgi:O-acetylhomoserine/O-acetylserine sulfhydrylase-like pyridoxal-dependent enzyme